MKFRNMFKQEVLLIFFKLLKPCATSTSTQTLSTTPHPERQQPERGIGLDLRNQQLKVSHSLQSSPDARIIRHKPYETMRLCHLPFHT